VPLALSDGWKTASADTLQVDPYRLALLTSSIRSWPELGVIPASWIQLSTRRHFRFRPRTGPDAGGEFGYGYFWWYSCYPSAAGLIEARTAVGNMIVTIFAGRYNDFTIGNTLGATILRAHVLPAVKSGVRPGCPGTSISH